MRGRFKQQLSLGVIPISEVKINTKSRHQLLPLLNALQYVFVTPKLNKAVFDLLESHIITYNENHSPSTTNFLTNRSDIPALKTAI